MKGDLKHHNYHRRQSTIIIILILVIDLATVNRVNVTIPIDRSLRFVCFILAPNCSICPNLFVLANLLLSHLTNFIYYRYMPVNFIMVDPSGCFIEFFCCENVVEQMINEFVQIERDSPSLYMEYLVGLAFLREKNQLEKSNKQFFRRIGKFSMKIGWKIAKLFLFQTIKEPGIHTPFEIDARKIVRFSPIFI